MASSSNLSGFRSMIRPHSRRHSLNRYEDSGFNSATRDDLGSLLDGRIQEFAKPCFRILNLP